MNRIGKPLFLLFGIFLSIGVFFLCTCLGLLEKTLEIWAW